MAHGIIVWLTEEQSKLVQPVMEKARKMAILGKPGMVMAQVFENHMDVGFVEHERALLLAKSGGRIIGSALEKSGGQRKL